MDENRKKNWGEVTQTYKDNHGIYSQISGN